LAKAKKNNRITVVNTVFDFRNEKKNPGLPWPLVEQKADFGLIDLLIMDREEAIRISGRKNMDEAAEFFSSTDVSSFIITNGAEKIAAWSGGGLFEKTDRIKMPVSNTVVDKIKSDPRQKGDTTGCGDNFAGGLVSSLAWQMKKKVKGKFSLPEAVSWGVASGGFCCFTVGGTYLETAPGEKRKEVEQIQKAYLDQIAL
jgi:sugar/nucleoside kinase (ribokinase family)